MRLFVWGFAAGSMLLAAAPKEVTFHKSVEPILQERCQGCHRPGEAAPMSLLSYKEARPWAKAMKDAVLLKKMPPWYADPAHGSFSNDRRLSKDEVDALVAWADSGAKEGNAADAPPARTFTDGWVMGKPDKVVQMPEPFHVPASGTIEYTYVVVPTGFTEDTWVQQVEVRPGNRAVVHHVVVLVRPPGVKYMADAKPGVPYVPPKDPDEGQRRPDTGQGQFMFTGALQMVGVYVPGGDPYILKPGQARFIPKGSDIVFQMHYTSNGKAGDDQSKIGFILAKEPPKERVVNTFVGNTNFRIPPQDGDFTVHARVTMYDQATLLSVFPHMHVRGKAMMYRATYPSGETETLADIPKYDFNWQLSYYFKEPKVLPKGTVLEVIAKFDNSPNNRSNPDPTKEVFWGEQTWEEMVAGFVDFAMPVTTSMRDIAAPKKPATKAGN